MYYTHKRYFLEKSFMLKNNNESQEETKKPYKIHDTFFKNSMADLTVACSGQVF